MLRRCIMADRYKSSDELAANERLDIDYRIELMAELVSEALIARRPEI